MIRHLYDDKRIREIIATMAVPVFFTSLILLRTQAVAGDERYRKAASPHHSSAISPVNIPT
jgi:hypothetical protein